MQGVNHWEGSVWNPECPRNARGDMMMSRKIYRKYGDIQWVIGKYGDIQGMCNHIRWMEVMLAHG